MNLLKSKFFLGALVAVVAVFGFTTANAAYMHTTLLKMGQSSSQVMSLQQTLNAGGFLVSTTGAGSPGMESMYFGAKTKAAVMAFQAAKGLSVDGVVGAQSGAALAAMTGGTVTYPAGCTSTTGFSTTTGTSCASTGSTTLPAGCTAGAMYSSTTGMACASTTGGTTPSTNGPLTGGAGSITVDDSSEFSSEEVGEGEEDVEVLQFSVEADDESDVEVTSVKVEFVQGTAADSEDLTDYAESVSIWFDGEMVGEADADDFSENSDVWTKSISLDGAIVRMGDEENFVVAVTALSNLDSGDIDTDAWTADVLNVRFEDAEGVVTTEDTDADTLEKTFDFATFATATDTELKVSLNDADDEINEAHVINVETTGDTDGVEILSFTLEAEGDSDINVTEIPVIFTVTGGSVDEAVLIVAARLFHGGVAVGGVETVPTGGVTVFDDLDIDISAGDTEEFTIEIDIQDLPGVLTAGDTFKAELSATADCEAGAGTATCVDLIEADDESGEQLAAADLTGSALGEASEVRDIGMMVTLVGTPTAVISHTGDIVGSGAGDDDQGTFEIVFDVTAFDGDVYIDGTSPTLTGAGALLDLNLTETGTHALTSATITSPSGATLTGTANADARFKVAEGDTERFKVTAVLTVSVDGFASIAIGDIVYALTDVTGTTSYTFNLNDFKTGDLYMNAN